MRKGSIGTTLNTHSNTDKERWAALRYKGAQKKKKANICLSCKSNIEGYCKKYACKCYIASNECEKTSYIKLDKPTLEKKKTRTKKNKNKTSKKK